MSNLAQLEIQPALIEQVERRLIEGIVDGRLPGGHRLTQESAAAMLGVSRQPVSHALQALRRRGLLVEHGKRGLAVVTLGAARIRDLYQVRAALDGLAAVLAAERVASGAAPTSAVDAIRAALARGRSLSGDADLPARIAADVAFHEAVYALSGNTAVGDAVAAQWPHFMRSMALVLNEAAVRARVWDEHEAIVTAILGGDGAAAGRLSQKHATRAGNDAARRLETTPNREPMERPTP
jgi:DNA-binding GntR family transcriptional regulator